jgi:hypothetical protein
MLNERVLTSATKLKLILCLPLAVGPVGCLLGLYSDSETSVNFYQTTRQHIPEHTTLHTHLSENLEFNKA